MIYPKNFEQKLGFDRIVRQVAERCSTRRGKELLSEEGFSSDAAVIAERLALCGELRTCLMLESDFPRGEFAEFAGVATKLGIEGAFLEVTEVQALGRGLRDVDSLLGFVGRSESYPTLRRLSEGIDSFPRIFNHIESLIDRFGNVKDSASPELYDIRRTIRQREGSVSKRLQAILAQAVAAGYADSDASVSIRDGRAVIPVSAANKRRVPGFIHDQSATGKTFYIEPVEIVEINNELKELAYAERREVVRVLTEFTDSIRENSEGIEAAADYLAQMDMIRGKARWALDNDATVPIISDEGRLSLRKARHPLLRQALAREKKEVVPLDMTLDAQNRILVISGPNAGGKSVCLKTVGLLQYMFQSGLPVTALDNSEMPVFDSLFIDIGDEQSIDNDLSTYSSHLHNMRAMLSGASPKSLVLIDEFGSGTEPVIGGAISEAILEKFVEQGTYGVITTHYTNIKYFASNHEGVFNGAMMFDVQNIAPLFRLETGTPGSSFAVEIARKTGLPEQIIASAGAKAGSDYMNLERQLREVARDRRYWEQKRDRIRVTDRRVEELENSYAESLARLKEERRTIIKEAKEEAARIIAEANRQIENTIRTIKESQAEKEATRRARSEFDSFRSEVADAEKSAESSERQAAIEREMARVAERQRRRAERKMQQGEKSPTTQSAEPEKLEVAVGRKVRISGQEIIGEVKEMQGKKALVAFGQILTTVAINRLEVVSTAEFKKQNRPQSARTVVSVDISSRKLNFKDNIDVRGMRAAEALERVTEFIDDAIMVGVGTVTILHGKGTGALKEEIRRYLRSLREVARAEDDHPDRGGAGITVVTFR